MISSRRGAAQGGDPLLDRTHRFLTARERPEVESAADRFFGALGYRRRADEGRALVFERGRRLASFYCASVRGCYTRLDVDLEHGSGTGVAVVRHRVETRGRFVTAGDQALLEAEARAFERFIEEADIDTAALLEAARRASRRRALARIAIGIGCVAAVALGWIALALARGR